MAPVLLCPECGTKHPLDGVAGNTAFPCSGCGRTLKVPAQARAMTADARPADPAPGHTPPPPSPAPAPVAAEAHHTQVLSTPAAPPMAVPAAAAAAAAAPVGPPLGAPQGIPAVNYGAPRVAVEPASAPPPPNPAIPPSAVRFLLWIVAVPLAFIFVFGFAKASGILTTNDITDVALAEGWRRFIPILTLLPFVAVATALLVTGGVYLITRLRSRGKKAPAPTTAPKPRADQPSRTIV